MGCKSLDIFPQRTFLTHIFSPEGVENNNELKETLTIEWSVYLYVLLYEVKKNRQFMKSSQKPPE